MITNTLIAQQRHSIAHDDLLMQTDYLLNNPDVTFKATLHNVRKNDLIEDVLKMILQGKQLKYNPCDEFSYKLELAGAIK